MKNNKRFEEQKSYTQTEVTARFDSTPYWSIAPEFIVDFARLPGLFVFEHNGELVAMRLTPNIPLEAKMVRASYASDREQFRIHFNQHIQKPRFQIRPIDDLETERCLRQLMKQED